MGRTLRYIGLAVLAGAAWILLAEEAGWVPADTSEVWLKPALFTGAACFGMGLLAALLAPVARSVRRGHCVRCGAPIEKGQTYCLDHLRDTLNEYQDRVRG